MQRGEMSEPLEGRVITKDSRRGRILPEKNSEYPDQVYYLPVSMPDLDETVSTLSRARRNLSCQSFRKKW